MRAWAYTYFHYLFLSLYSINCHSTFSFSQSPSVSNMAKLNPTVLKYYLHVFENCTNIIIISNDENENLNIDHTPIVLRNQYYPAEKVELTQIRFSILRRRNPSLHCWAWFYLLLEDHIKQTNSVWLSTQIPPLPVGQRFLISTTNLKSTIDLAFEIYGREFLLYWNFEIILLEIDENIPQPASSMETADHKVRMQYYNVYHHKGLMVLGQPSKVWYWMECFPYSANKCFNMFQRIGEAIAVLHKHFPTNEHAYRQPEAGSSIKKWYKDGSKETRLHEIVQLTTFSEFVSFWSIQDSSEFATLNITACIGTPTHFQFPSAVSPCSYILREVQTYSFTSCYKVKSDTFILSALITPFDIESWLLLIFCFVTTVLILTLLPRTISSEGTLVGTGILLENSVLGDLKQFQDRFTGKSQIVGVHVLIGVWVIMTGTVLTNWFKTSFTMEMIIPVKYSPPWKTWLDIEGMHALLPLQMFDYVNIDPRPPPYMHFLTGLRHKINHVINSTR